MTDDEKAVIVGCWLNGAKYEAIANVFGISVEYVQLIIKEYQKLKNDNQEKNTKD